MNQIEEFKQECLDNMQKEQAIESEKQIELIIFKLHHLLRTNQIEGIYSSENTNEYSCIEKMLKKTKFKDYMRHYMKSHAEKLKPIQRKYIFKGTWKNCEEAWVHRNDPGKYSIFDTGVYGEEEKLLAEAEKLTDYIKCIQNEPMHFGKIKRNEDGKEYKCDHIIKFSKKN